MSSMLYGGRSAKEKEMGSQSHGKQLTRLVQGPGPGVDVGSPIPQCPQGPSWGIYVRILTALGSGSWRGCFHQKTVRGAQNRNSDSCWVPWLRM